MVTPVLILFNIKTMQMTYFRLYIIKVVKGIEIRHIPLLLEPSYAIHYMEKGGDIYGRYQTVSDKSSSGRTQGLSTRTVEIPHHC